MLPALQPSGTRTAGAIIGHYLQLKDQSGAVVATFVGGGRGASLGGLSSFSYRKRLRTPGATTVRISGLDDRIASFLALDANLDAQWEFFRNDPLIGSVYTLDHESFHRAEELNEMQDGSVIYISRGQGYNVLLRSEAIRYAAGSAETNKSGDSATVAREFVDENIGPGAGLDSNGDPRVMPGLSLAAFPASGITWSGGRTNKNLEEVLDEIADFAPADYMVVGIGAALFEVQWRDGRWGEDRTTGNAAGNPVIRFSARSGNVAIVKSRYSHLNAVTTVYVMGQGRGASRKFATVSDAVLLAASPWSRRAIARSQTNEPDTANLAIRGQEQLDKQRARRMFEFRVTQTEAVRYGRDWFMGDLVEVEDYALNVASIKIIGVTISVSGDGKETITPEFEAE